MMNVKNFRLSIMTVASTVMTAVLAVPLLTLAQTEGADQINTTLQSWLTAANSLVALLMALAVAAFFWGLVKFLFKIGGEDGAEDGKRIMIWGVVALFVMVSIWGIIQFLADQFGVGGPVESGQLLNAGRFQVE